MAEMGATAAVVCRRAWDALLGVAGLCYHICMNYARGASIVLILMAACVASACDVPVFEYALENWPADSYVLVVFTVGKTSEDDTTLVKWLQEMCEGDGNVPNLGVRVVNKLDDSDPSMRSLWEKVSSSSSTGPAASKPSGLKAALLAPGGRVLLWSGTLTRATAEAIIDSPARKELANRLKSGHAGVWVLVEDNNSSDNNKAAVALLKSKLAEANQSLQATAPISVQEVETTTGPAMRNVEFSFMMVSPSDPKEEMFIAMLRLAEDEAHPVAGPIAIPIFGRGRALCAFGGWNLTADSILSVCEFLVGDCSCEVKNQNPGADMLMWTNWEDRLTSGAGVERTTAAPTGLTAIAAPLDSQPAGIGAVEDIPSVRNFNWPLVRNVLLALAGVAVVGGALAILARRKPSSKA